MDKQQNQVNNSQTRSCLKSYRNDVILGLKGESGDAGAPGLPGLAGIIGDAGM